MVLSFEGSLWPSGFIGLTSFAAYTVSIVPCYDYTTPQNPIKIIKA